MKLYTEEQVREIIEKSRKTGLTADYLILVNKGIELPSDEEITQSITCSNLGLRYDFSMSAGFKKGAKWMRDKIQGGNK